MDPKTTILPSSSTTTFRFSRISIVLIAAFCLYAFASFSIEVDRSASLFPVTWHLSDHNKGVWNRPLVIGPPFPLEQTPKFANFTATDVASVIYPIADVKEEDYNPDTPLIMTVLHESKSLVAFVQGIGKMDSWDVTNCQVGNRVLTTSMSRIWRYKWWVVVECVFPEKGFHMRELDGGAVTLSFRNNGSGRKVITSNFGFDSDKTLPAPIESTLPYRTCIVTELYNQTHVLKDWLTYHNSIGVDHFIIYDNDSGDDLPTFIDTNNFTDLVTLIRWPWTKSQPHAFLHGKLLADRLCHWTFFPDVDEYLFLKQCQHSRPPSANSSTTMHKPFTHCLPSLISNHTSYNFTHPSTPHTTQLLLTPKIFSSSSIIRHPPQPYTLPETYTHRTPYPHTLSFSTPKPIIYTRAAKLSTWIHNFHTSTGRTTTLPIQVAHLIHYKAQSWEDYMVKFVRPRVGYVKDWGLPEGLEWPLSRDKPPKGWEDGTFFGERTLKGPWVVDTEFRDWKRWMEGVLMGRGNGTEGSVES
ncbi:hypothetical protein HDV00_007384 [Rhizophlyctis rosea]|nr:hypothetical protein HDV00_007384 [Rhizophlyctis rosea]